MTTHTPGPWKVRDGDEFIFDDTLPVYDPNGAVVCAFALDLYGCWQFGSDEVDPRQNAEAEANARLIVAAANSYDKHCGPNANAAAEGDLLGELLAACKQVASILDDYAPHSSWKLDAIQCLRAAIAKAQGDQA